MPLTLTTKAIEKLEDELEPAGPYRVRNFLRDNFAENIAADVRARLTSDPKSIPSR